MLLHLCLPLVLVFIQPTLSTYNCSSEYDRVPDNTDMMVDCGTSMITLEVNLCSAQWAGFNATGLALNGEHSIPDCQGTIHTDVVPPVIRYQLPVNHTQANLCRQSLQIVDEAPDPSGHFGDFSTVQSLIITGFVDTPGSSEGLISYATDLYYHFSCRYPLEYLLNNTQIIASSVSVANRDNNGTFIDTLKMTVYNDTNYNHQLLVPVSGLELRTKIYVEVEAVNMTGNFNLFLNHCFATSSPYNLSQTERHNFFIAGCSVNQKAALTINGVAKNSRFNFEAFRFVEHRDQEKSSIYLHCILRLCEPTKCQELIDACTSRRRRRWARSVEQDTEEVATVSFGPLAMGRGDSSLAAEDEDAASQSPAEDSSVTAVVLGALFGSAAVTLVILASWMAVKKFYYSGAGLSAFN
ncbi:zona pellucida-like domain-containing protein 1 [Gadus chalcogrammus]|uniref:zona pellucida-like domain-containing protein 1 n=1 Tax=Gadus chalcogrammus TaxID=1042646 RepID=UPI0024C4D581|nr:zona pellucida-like domain-containing protein 1 [Gadus chalcogrammus]